MTIRLTALRRIGRRRSLPRSLAQIAALLCCGIASLTTAQEPDQAMPDLVNTTGLAASGFRVLFSLVLVLGLFVLCAWAMRRWRERVQTGSGPIEVVSGLSLGSKERVVLLRVGREQVLVGLSPAGMRALHVLPEAGTGAPFRAHLEAID